MRWFSDPRVRRWAADAAVLLVCLLPLLSVADPAPGQRIAPEELRAVTVPVLTAAVLVSRRWPAAAAAAPAALAVAVSGGLDGGFLFAVMLLAFLMGRRAARRRAVPELLGCLAAIALAQLTWPDSAPRDWFTVGTGALLMVVLPWAAGRIVHLQASLTEAGWSLAERLERERDRVAEQVRLRERTRIAADMHDSLGHELSLIAVRAAALRVGPDVGEQGRRAAEELRRSAADATERLREIIGMLREDGAPAPLAPTDTSVAELVRRAAASGMDVTLDDITGDAPGEPLPRAGVRAARRVVQEGLTNAAKHALGRPVRVSLHRDGDLLVVSVSNGLSGAARSAPPGYGLVGLDERVRLAGGRLEAGERDGRFAIRAELPVRAAAPTPPTDALRSHRAEEDARRAMVLGIVGAFRTPAVIAVLLFLLYLVNGGWN